MWETVRLRDSCSVDRERWRERERAASVAATLLYAQIDLNDVYEAAERR